jgi:xanthine dehydrogenase YagT iron-sulfur-binding subunit
MKKNPSEQPKRLQRPISRRSFLTTAGTGAVCIVANRRVFAAKGNKTKAALLEPGVATPISLRINGQRHDFLVEPRWTLLYVLRERFGLAGTKEGCGRGECGACTVLVDDVARYACLTLAVEADGAAVTTVEGLLRGEELGPVQSAFVEEDAFQCGYCTPGQIMSVEALLRKNPDPSVEEIRVAVSGNLCRCGAYSHIFKAAAKAAKAAPR